MPIYIEVSVSENICNSQIRAGWWAQRGRWGMRSSPGRLPWVVWGKHLSENSFLIHPALVECEGLWVWEEEGLKLLIALNQRVHRAFHSPSAPQGLGELKLLLLFKCLSSCSFSSCHLLACLWLMTGPSIPVLPSLLHSIPYFFPPFPSTSIFFPSHKLLI